MHQYFIKRLALFLALALVSPSTQAQELFDQNVQYNIVVDLKEDTSLQVSYEVIFADKKRKDRKHFQTRSQDSFMLILMEDMAQMDLEKNKILFYMHGMWGGRRINFNHAYDLMSKAYLDHPESDFGRILSLKWPGNKVEYKENKKVLYAVAEEISDLTFTFIRKFQALDFLNNNYSTSVDLLVHSLGNELFKEMLNHLDYNNTYYPFFDEVILAASDKEVDAFDTDESLSLLPRIASRTTIYFSPRDITLGISKNLNKRSRLGLDGPISYDKIPENIFFVNTLSIADELHFGDKMTGHSYYRASPIVTKDMLDAMMGKQTFELRVSDEGNPILYFLEKNTEN